MLDAVEGEAETRPDGPIILVFIHSFGPGGVERIALRLAEHWFAAGVDVRIVVGRDDGPMRNLHSHVAAARWPVLGYGWKTLRLVAAVRAEVIARRPDVLFCPGNSYTLIAILLRLLLGRRCPPIVAKMSNDLMRYDLPVPVRWAYRRWLWAQGRLIDQFAVLSDAMAVETRERLGIAAARVTVMPNPVLNLADVTNDAGRPAPSGGRRFVAVGRLVGQKDFPMMLRAFAAGAREGDTLTIVGEGPARRALERLVVSLGLAGHVDFAGYRRDVRVVLCASDILLLSSRYEGLPGVVVEALAYGLAIIATRCSTSMAPLLEHGALGTLVAVGDQAAFAAAIAGATPGTQDRESARATARAFTVEAAAPAYLALFARIAGARRRHGQIIPSLKVRPT